MKQMTQRQLNTLKELASCLPEKQVKKITTKTIQKWVKEKCENFASFDFYLIFFLVRCTNSRLKLEDYKSKLLQLVALSYKPPQPPEPPRVTDSISVSDYTNSTQTDTLIAHVL